MDENVKKITEYMMLMRDSVRMGMNNLFRVEGLTDEQKEHFVEVREQILKRQNRYTREAEKRIILAELRKNELRNLFKDNETFNFALKLFEHLDIRGEGKRCTVTKRKAGILVAAMKAILDAKLLNESKIWTLDNLYPIFQQYLGIHFNKAETNILSKWYTENITVAKDFLKARMKDPNA